MIGAWPGGLRHVFAEAEVMAVSPWPAAAAADGRVVLCLAAVDGLFKSGDSPANLLNNQGVMTHFKSVCGLFSATDGGPCHACQQLFRTPWQ